MRSSVLGVRLNFDAVGAAPLEYRRQLVRDFSPEIRVFVPANVLVDPPAEPAWPRMAEAGRLAVFHNSSEIEPREPGPSPRRVHPLLPLGPGRLLR